MFESIQIILGTTQANLFNIDQPGKALTLALACAEGLGHR